MKEIKGAFSIEKYKNDIMDIGTGDICEYFEIGNSIFGRPIYSLSLGKGEKVICIVGGVNGKWEDAYLILSFVKEFCRMYRDKRRVYNVNPSYVLSCRRFVIIPLLNPDGAVYRSEGVDKENVLRERLIAINGGSDDFSVWETNGRGVSLDGNVPVGFPERRRYEEANEIYGSPIHFSGQTPVSEPELCALYSRLCKEKEISFFADISSGGEGYVRGGICNDKKGRRISESLARVGGIKHLKSVSPDALGIADWIGESYCCPSLRISLESSDYERVRELFYTIPLLV